MKTTKIFAALCCTAMLFAACEKNKVSDPENNENNVQTDGRHEYVDLGLPSGTLWATCNVGANKPEEFGNYYAWGETETKSIFSWTNYKFAGMLCTYDCDDADYFTKYAVFDSISILFADNKTILEEEDDAATANWGKNWRMPSKSEWNELLSYCTWTWTTRNNVKGYCAKANNGNSIFFPMAGYKEKFIEEGVEYDQSEEEVGFYWSNLLDDDGYNNENAYLLSFGEEWLEVYDDYRMIGGSVRAVYSIAKEKKETDLTATGNENGHDYVDLGLPSNTLWATCNVGATKPQDFGNYYAWGETVPKSSYNWETYKYGNSDTTITKYCSYLDYGVEDYLSILEANDDVAYTEWGGKWSIPTQSDWNELLSNCILDYTDYEGVTGLKFKSKLNEHEIFIPAAGYYSSDTLKLYDGIQNKPLGAYWSSSVCPMGTAAESLMFAGNYLIFYGVWRYAGLTVRPVLKKQ